MTVAPAQPWDVLEPAGPPCGVVLVAHGLNQRAHALRSLYEPLRERGAVIVVLNLRGHRRDTEPHAHTIDEWRSLELAAWHEDWIAAATAAAALARRHTVPLTFLGFSLGALVHTFGLATSDVAPGPFARQVLLAPAIRIRQRSRMVLMLRMFGKRFLVPSFTPRAVRSHEGTSVAAYQALFWYESALATVAHPERLRVPTLVVMDPRDELASARLLTRWIEAHRLAPDWHMRHITRDPATAASGIRHYIIDEAGLGTAPFAELVEVVCAALLDPLRA